MVPNTTVMREAMDILAGFNEETLPPVMVPAPVSLKPGSVF